MSGSLVARRWRFGFAPRAVLAASLVLGVGARARAQSAPNPADAAPGGDDDDAVVEVGGAQRTLPRVTFVPADAASLAATNELARLVALTGRYYAGVAAPGSPAGGLVARVLYAGAGAAPRIEAETQRLDGSTRRRVVAVGADSRALDFARAADGLVVDLSGERSHLSGRILFTDGAVPGERRVRFMLGEGTPVRDVSPEGMLARGADVGPGGIVHFAAARLGEPMRLYAEGDAHPITLGAPGFVQGVAFTPDRNRFAVAIGTGAGGAVFAGPWGGELRAVEPGAAISLGPSFGPGGELAYLAGPAEGPLRVMVDGRAVSPAGQWASAVSFCPRGGHNRVVYALRDGAGGSRVVITDLDSRETHEVARGGSPACSPDGRTVAFVRSASRAGPAGVWLAGEDGIAEHRVRDGDAAGLRWLPGPE